MAQRQQVSVEAGADMSAAGLHDGDPVTAGQVRRDRQRLVRAWAAADQLQARLDAIEGSPIWRATGPVRRLLARLPPPARRALLRGLKLLWWTVTLQLPGRVRAWRRMRAAPPVSRPALVAPSRPARPLALVVDSHWPQPDRDAGSMEIMTLAETLGVLGYEVVFAAALDWAAMSSDRDALAARQIRCLGPADAPSLEDYLRGHGGRIALCVLCRVYCGGHFLELVQAECRAARIVFDTIDLHFLRLEREARLAHDQEGLAQAARTQAREEHIAREADVTMVVSSAERDLLARLVPEARVIQTPLARPVLPPRTPWEARRGIGFIGGFAHGPNRDAIQFFLREIWPLVLREIPDCEFSIVGADMPADLLRDVPGTVRYLGHLPDVGPWFESLRLTVAPLRFGAGAKGKVASSLAAGVPCVVTSVAMEGMSIQDGIEVLAADTPQLFADQVARAYTDPAIWAALSAASTGYVTRHLSKATWQERLRAALYAVDALPVIEAR